MKKIIKMILLTAVLFLFTNNVNAASCTLEDSRGFCLVTSSDVHKKIEGKDVFTTSFATEPGTSYFKISDDNEIIYCSNVILTTDELNSSPWPIDYNCGEKTAIEKSAIFIYEYGYGSNKKSGEYKYNSKYLTGDAIKDYYITQTAIWSLYPPDDDSHDGYLIDTIDWANHWFHGYDFTAKTYFGVSDPIVTKISNLVNDAVAAKSATPSIDVKTSNTSMKVTSDDQYYISDAITLTGKYLTEEITLKVSGATDAFVTTDKNATSGITTISDGTEPSISTTLYVKVPAKSVTNAEVDIKLNVSSKSTFTDDSQIIECWPHQYYYDQSMVKFNPKLITLSDEITLGAEKYPVEITKKDTNGKILDGATLVVKKGSTVIDTWTTGTSSKTLLLVPGTYTLEETKVPTGYTADKTSITFVVSEDGKVLISNKEVSEVTMTNTPINVTISKKSITGSDELEGATLTITDKNGNIAKDINGNKLEWVSTTKAKSFHLAAGTYILTEKIAPEGYILSKEEIEFTVTTAGKILIGGKEVSQVVMTNEPINVTISKKSITGTEELEGASLTITDKDGNIAKDVEGNELKWTSTTNAKTFHLAVGTYILTEKIAPKGYILSKTTIEFTVTEEGKVLINNKEVKEIVMTNEPIKVSISKKSIVGTEELAGAILVITDKNGNIAKDMDGKKLEWTSTTKPKTFHLAAGTYILSEKTAPKGYELSETKIEFVVNNDGTVTLNKTTVKDNLIVFENTPEPEQVPTGSLVVYIAGALCLISLGVSIFFIVKRKKI